VGSFHPAWSAGGRGMPQLWRRDSHLFCSFPEQDSRSFERSSHRV